MGVTLSSPKRQPRVSATRMAALSVAGVLPLRAATRRPWMVPPSSGRRWF